MNADKPATNPTPKQEGGDLRSCTICGLTVDVSKGHVAPASDFTMQGRTKPKPTPGAAVVVGDGAMAGWITDGDNIPAELIKVTRDAICMEFGNNGTDGYYKRILVKVFSALASPPAGEWLPPQRYAMEVNGSGCDCCDAWVQPVPDSGGDWVNWSDLTAALPGLGGEP